MRVALERPKRRSLVGKGPCFDDFKAVALVKAYGPLGGGFDIAGRSAGLVPEGQSLTIALI